MNRYVLLGALLLILASCSQQRFSFRKTIPVDQSAAQEKKKEELARVEKEKTDLAVSSSIPVLPVDSTPLATGTKKAPVYKKAEEKLQLSASVFKNIIPFTLDQLSPEPKYSAPRDPDFPEDDSSIVISILSLVFGVLAVMALFAAMMVESFYILLILSPLFAIVAVIAGIIALSTGSEGKGFAIAGLIAGGVIVILALLVLLIIFLIFSNMP